MPRIKNKRTRSSIHVGSDEFDDSFLNPEITPQYVLSVLTDKQIACHMRIRAHQQLKYSNPSYSILCLDNHLIPLFVSYDQHEVEGASFTPSVMEDYISQSIDNMIEGGELSNSGYNDECEYTVSKLLRYGAATLDCMRTFPKNKILKRLLIRLKEALGGFPSMVNETTMNKALQSTLGKSGKKYGHIYQGFESLKNDLIQTWSQNPDPLDIYERFL